MHNSPFVPGEMAQLVQRQICWSLRRKKRGMEQGKKKREQHILIMTSCRSPIRSEWTKFGYSTVYVQCGKRTIWKRLIGESHKLWATAKKALFLVSGNLQGRPARGTCDAELKAQLIYSVQDGCMHICVSELGNVNVRRWLWLGFQLHTLPVITGFIFSVEKRIHAVADSIGLKHYRWNQWGLMWLEALGPILSYVLMSASSAKIQSVDPELY